MRPAADTLVAAATAPGGAVAIVRLSGPQAIPIAERLFRTANGVPFPSCPPRTMLFGTLVDPSAEGVLDEVLCTLFRAPHSYTGEDSVEFSCHGSPYIVRRLVDLCIEAGARAAGAGEFTLRAFLAGKLDLSEAEAVADLVAASDRAQHALALGQMRGGYAAALRSLREEMVRLSALVELELDFGEEDVEFADRGTLRALIERLGGEVERLASTFTRGNALREGVAVAIVGMPNVGKSTLLNALVGEDRALVSPIAGTTRDTVEERFDVGGIRFRLIDTAGLHRGGDPLERMGMERTRAALVKAPFVLAVTDLSALPEQDVPQALQALRQQACAIPGFPGSTPGTADSTYPYAAHGFSCIPDRTGPGSAGDPIPGDPAADKALAREGVDDLDGACSGEPRSGEGAERSAPADRRTGSVRSSACGASAGFPVAKGSSVHTATEEPTGTPTGNENKDENGCGGNRPQRPSEFAPGASVDTDPGSTAPQPAKRSSREEGRSACPTPIGAFRSASPDNQPPEYGAPSQRFLLVLNKRDCAPEAFWQALVAALRNEGVDAVALSARAGSGLHELETWLTRAAEAERIDQADAIVTHARHYEALRRTANALRRALSAVDDRLPTDLLAEELRDALFHLGAVTGEVATEEVLTEIFSRFCIGK